MFAAANVLRHEFVTRWEAAEDDKTPVLTASFEDAVHGCSLESVLRW